MPLRFHRLPTCIGVALISGCAGPSHAQAGGPNVPLDLWPRVLAHAAAEELRPPRRRCESDERDGEWVALAARLRGYDHALRGRPAVEGAPQTDAEISALLRDALAERGWPEPCDLGDQASKQLWFVVQHTPVPESLNASATFFEAAADYGFIPGSQLATLRDRVLMRAGEPQIYGTQYVCDPDAGRRVGWATQDEDGLAARRVDPGPLGAADHEP